MSSWQVQDAKARFSEFLNATIKKGPQVVTRRGGEKAALVPIEEWRPDTFGTVVDWRSSVIAEACARRNRFV
jgi:prevent-host-death family protein